MSKDSGPIEVLNPLGNPHWVITHGKGETKGGPRSGPELPSISAWDAHCYGCVLRRTLMDLGIHVTSFRATHGSIQIGTLATNEMRQELLRTLGRLGIGYEILCTTTKSGTNAERGLTRHQLKLLRIALREGFYEYPRKIDLRSLGEMANCSPAALCETLRRGERAILSKYAGEPSFE